MTDAAPARVWDLWADASRWPEWNPGIVAAELHGPFAVGSTATIRFDRGRPLTFEVTAVEHERLFVDEARLPGARMGHEHALERADDRWRIRNRIYIAGPLGRVYALLLGRRIRASMDEMVRRERELAEADRPAASSP